MGCRCGRQLCRQLCGRSPAGLNGPGASDAVGCVRRRRTHVREAFESRPARSPSVSGWPVPRSFATLFRDGMALVEETASYLDGAGRHRIQKTRTQCGAGLRDREHAAHHAADATCLLAVAASRGQGRRDDARSGAARKRARFVLPPAIRAMSKSIALLAGASSRNSSPARRNCRAEVRRLDATMHAAVPVKIAIGNPVGRQIGTC
jgi:regulator of CtrA degradation